MDKQHSRGKSKGKRIEDYGGRLDKNLPENMAKDINNERDREDAHKYRTRKEVRETLVFYVAIVIGTLYVLHTLIQILEG